jgi:hypothetical protein
MVAALTVRSKSTLAKMICRNGGVPEGQGDCTKFSFIDKANGGREARGGIVSNAGILAERCLTINPHLAIPY